VILILAGLIVVVLGAMLFWLGEREPEYQGRKLSWWIADGNQRSLFAPETAGVREAVRGIGTNALPLLIRRIKSAHLPEKSNLEAKVASASKSAGDVWEHARLEKLRPATDAVWAFWILGEQGSPAIPELVQLVGSTNRATSTLAFAALRGIGNSAVPAFVGFLENTNEEVRIWAKDCLEMLEPEVLRTNGVAGR
jgi:hypothetical protein